MSVPGDTCPTTDAVCQTQVYCYPSTFRGPKPLDDEPGMALGPLLRSARHYATGFSSQHGGRNIMAHLRGNGTALVVTRMHGMIRKVKDFSRARLTVYTVTRLLHGVRSST